MRRLACLVAVLAVACAPALNGRFGDPAYPSTSGASPGGAGPQEPASVTDVGAVRSAVGTRTREPAHTFAIRIAGAAGVRVRPDLRLASDADDLLDTAREVGAWHPIMELEPGDLVVFGGPRAALPRGGPARSRPANDGWLFGLVAARRDDGALEFVYALGGVVRRGFLHPGRPDEKRASDGRALNTIVRPYDADDPRGQKHLAGQLATGCIRLR